MTSKERHSLTKSEIAERLGVSTEDICKWTQLTTFADWLDICSQRLDRLHDQDDVLIFTLVSQFDSQLEESVPFVQRIQLIRRELNQVDAAVKIRHKRMVEKARPEIARWQVVDTAGIHLRYDYKWLEPLRALVDSVADFGCWASDTSTTCSEPYALLWILEAKRVVVIDKEPQYIQNAEKWLEATRQRYSYFNDYNLEFAVGDITDGNLIDRIDVLDEDSFDLSYCHNVLYNIYPDLSKLQGAIGIMTRIVRAGGWVLAVEPKMGVEYKPESCELFDGKSSIPAPPVPLNQPIDISEHFEVAGLAKFDLDNAPDWSYCYQKSRSRVVRSNVLRRPIVAGGDSAFGAE